MVAHNIPLQRSAWAEPVVEMDIDVPEEIQQSSSSYPSSRHIVAPVDDAHPFELDGYISNYTGKSALRRIVC